VLDLESEAESNFFAFTQIPVRGEPFKSQDRLVEAMHLCDGHSLRQAQGDRKYKLSANGYLLFTKKKLATSQSRG